MAKVRTNRKAKEAKSGGPAAPRGPFLAAAVFCERVITDKADSVPSMIRVVDSITVNPAVQNGIRQPVPLDQVFPTHLSFYFHFRAGEVRKNKRFELFVTSPDARREKYAHGEFPFSICKANNDGVNGVMPLELKWRGTGYYQYDVLLDGQLMTRLILRVELGESRQEERATERSHGDHEVK
jgi:hypothetical protein